MIFHLSINALDPANVATVLAELLGADDIAAQDRILEIAADAGWTSAVIDAGPFTVINVWLEGRQLIELTTPELVGDYLALYGTENREHLDGQLREVEQLLRSHLQPTA